MSFAFSKSTLVAFLFVGILLKCLSPLLHAHVGGSNDSGFHMYGLSTLNDTPSYDGEGDLPNPESIAMTVSDARKHFFYSIFIPVFIGLLLAVLRVHPVLTRFNFFKPFRVAFACLNQKSPPPALAPPLRYLT